MLVGCNEGILHHILGILLLIDNATNECHKGRAVPIYQQTEILGFTAAYVLYDYVVFVGHSTIYRRKYAKCHTK